MLPSIRPHVPTLGGGGFIRKDCAYLKVLGLKRYLHRIPEKIHMRAALEAIKSVAMLSGWQASGVISRSARKAGVPIVWGNCSGLCDVLNGSPSQRVPAGDAMALENAFVNKVENLEQRQKEPEVYQPTAVDRSEIARPEGAPADLYAQLRKHGR